MLHQTPYGTPEFELARRWAPFHWQEVRPSGSKPAQWKGDLVTAIDFDGDWRTIGNWDAMPNHPLIPVVYYSVVESETHWFILYAYYHPRDWSKIELALDMHENDMEGLLLIVEKSGPLAEEQPHGRLLGMIALAHNHFYSYSNVLQGNEENIDGPLFFARSPSDGLSHPCSRQEAEGHGCFGLQPTDSTLWDELGKPTQVEDALAAFQFPGGSGIRYFAGDSAGEPDEHGGVGEHDYPYVLVDIFEDAGMWRRKCGPPKEPYTAAQQFAGRKYGDDKASPPWKWDDKDHSSSLAQGIIALEPASLVQHYFKSLGNFSLDYVNNPYQQPLPCEDEVVAGVFASTLPPETGLGVATRTVRDARRAREVRRARRVRRSREARLERLVRAALDPAARAETTAWLRRRAQDDEKFCAALASRAHEVIAKAASAPRPRGGLDAAARLHAAIPAIEALGVAGDRSARPLLVQILQATSDRDVQLAALSAIGRLAPANQRGFKDALVGLLAHGDGRVREAAARLYADTLAARDPRPLARLAADPHTGVRAAAMRGLGRSRRAKDIELVSRAAADEEEEFDVRAAAVRTLAKHRPSRVPERIAAVGVRPPARRPRARATAARRGRAPASRRGAAAAPRARRRTTPRRTRARPRSAAARDREATPRRPDDYERLGLAVAAGAG